MHYGKTADGIWMPFGVVGQLGPRMRQVVGSGYCPMQEVILGVDVGHPIFSSGEFVA